MRISIIDCTKSFTFFHYKIKWVIPLFIYFYICDPFLFLKFVSKNSSINNLIKGMNIKWGYFLIQEIWLACLSYNCKKNCLNQSDQNIGDISMTQKKFTADRKCKIFLYKLFYLIFVCKSIKLSTRNFFLMT